MNASLGFQPLLGSGQLVHIFTVHPQAVIECRKLQILFLQFIRDCLNLSGFRSSQLVDPVQIFIGKGPHLAIRQAEAGTASF